MWVRLNPLRCWKQRAEFGRPFGVEFTNPDFVAYAQSFGMAAFRPASAADLYPTLMRALTTGARRSSRSPSTTARTCASRSVWAPSRTADEQPRSGTSGPGSTPRGCDVSWRNLRGARGLREMRSLRRQSGGHGVAGAWSGAHARLTVGDSYREVESGFRYTPTTCFETFPFPRPTDEQREAIAAAARELTKKPPPTKTRWKRRVGSLARLADS